MSLSAKNLVLAVDGSQRDQPLVLLVAGGGEIYWSAPIELPDPALITAVKEAMLLHRDRIGSVVAVRGPGSYIGVRGGLAAGLGVAQSLGCPLALLGALEVIAAQIDPAGEPVLALADAGRGGTFGQELEPGQGKGPPIRWRPRGGAMLLGRGVPWPDAWSGRRLVVGVPGEGRQLPAEVISIDAVRDRRMALAWSVTGGPDPIPGYDRVTADYAEPVGAR